MKKIVEGKEAVLGVNLGHPIVTNGDGDALFPNYFGEDLFNLARAACLLYACHMFCLRKFLSSF